jgi:hypothetical protein
MSGSAYTVSKESAIPTHRCQNINTRAIGILPVGAKMTCALLKEEDD